MVERLQKILSAAGICSRRTAESYIADGLVTVNGRPAQLGDKADPAIDRIALDGTLINGTFDVQHTLLMLYKPRGVVTTLSDERKRKTVADLIQDCPVRVWPIGRLDMDSEGLLLLTDDGELTNRLIHPKHEVEKEYLVWVSDCNSTAMNALSCPMTLEGQRLQPAKVRMVRRDECFTVLSITIHEGKNHQIRRMCASCGMHVFRLKRIREGRVYLDRRLLPGQWRYLTENEAELLGQGK